VQVLIVGKLAEIIKVLVTLCILFSVLFALGSFWIWRSVLGQRRRSLNQATPLPMLRIAGVAAAAVVGGITSLILWTTTEPSDRYTPTTPMEWVSWCLAATMVIVFSHAMLTALIVALGFSQTKRGWLGAMIHRLIAFRA
jgi:hypothetical protein